MGFLDRFKKKKEQELEAKAPAAALLEAPEKSAAASTQRTAKKKEPLKKDANRSKEREHKVSQEIPESLLPVVVRPLVTEKSSILASLNQYVFMVHVRANRVQVRQAIRALYGVSPLSVRMQNMRREPVRFGRFHGKQKAWKKAIVTLPKGQSIHVHEGV